MTQLEATWCITNICAGSRSHIESLVSKGLFELLPKILDSKYEKIFEQGAWAVGNISADEGTFKEILLKYNIMEKLVTKILTSRDEEVLKYTNWALCNLVTGTSQNIKKNVAMAALIKIILTQNDPSMINDSLRALLDLTDNPTVHILIESKLVPRFFELIKMPFKNILFTILQLIAYITNGTDKETQAILDCGGVEVIFALLAEPGTDVACRRECLWIISNILVGTYEQMKYVFSKNQWVDTLFNHSINENEKVKKEAIWCLCNSTKNADENHIALLIERGIFIVFNNNMDVHTDCNVLKTILEALSHILRWGVPEVSQMPNRFQAHLETTGVLDRIQNLQLHPSQTVYQYTSNLIEQYFQVHDPI